jgi:hypothetical protein
MIKKLFLGALLSTLLGATGVGLLDAPAPRPLDRFPVTIRDGQVSVDTSTAIQRDRVSQADIVYAEEERA